MFGGFFVMNPLNGCSTDLKYFLTRRIICKFCKKLENSVKNFKILREPCGIQFLDKDTTFRYFNLAK